MSKVRIFQFPFGGNGGVKHYGMNIWRHLDKSKFACDFGTVRQRLEFEEEVYSSGAGAKYIPCSAEQDPERFRDEIWNLLYGNYDVVHLHTSYWKSFLVEEVAMACKIPKVIVHSHSTFIDEPCDKKRRELLLQHEKVKREFPVELATDFWACSQTAADWLFGPQIPRSKIKIMKNAIELERFQFDQGKRDHIRVELGLQDSLILGAVGRLCYAKNPEFLIELFEKFHQKYQNSKLIIVGDGELRLNLEHWIQERDLMDSVLILGWKTNVEDYLQAMDYFLLPSRFEGLPISVLEASASGLPCIVSDQVTEEIEISEQIQRVPLDTAAWISALEGMGQCFQDRPAGTEILRAAGYDIKQQAKLLEELYQM